MKKQNVIILVIVLVVVGLGGMIVLTAGGLLWYMWQGQSIMSDRINGNSTVPCGNSGLECAVDDWINDTVNGNENVNVNGNVNANDSVTEDTVVAPGGYLDMTWFDAPVEHSATDYGFTVPADAYAYGGTDVALYYKVYEVGTIESAPYAGQPLLIVQRTCDGPCGYSHYRVVDDRTGSGDLVLLRTISNQLYEGDEQYFTVTDAYDIADVHLPNQLTISVDGQDLSFEAEDFSPAVLFDEYTGDEYAGEYQARYTHPLYGTLYESMNGGFYMVRLPDGTNKIYLLEMPFNIVESSDSGSYRPVTDLYVFDANGELAVDGTYSPIEWPTCPPREYAFNRDVTIDDLEQVGTFYNYTEFEDDPIYRFKDPNYSKLQEKYDFLYEPEYSYDEYVSNDPILLAEDKVGRWMELYNTNYQPLAEMGCFYINSAL